MVLSECQDSQKQLESNLESQLHLHSQPHMHPQSQLQLKLQPMPPELPARQQLPPMVQRSHSLQNLSSPRTQASKQESYRPRTRASSEANDGTPKKQKQCNCKSSRCLKLYCECFAAGIYCRNCNCGNCQNSADNEAARQEAVGATLECNTNAFRPKIASSPHGFRDKRVHYLTPASLQHLLISALHWR